MRFSLERAERSSRGGNGRRSGLAGAVPKTLEESDESLDEQAGDSTDHTNAGGMHEDADQVAGGSCYGAAGSRPITEDEPPRPSASGRWLVPTLDRLNGYVLRELPIVTAIPGPVYGNGSRFRELVIEPVKTGRRVLQFGTIRLLVSPIHVHDCVRALVHLAEHGKVGGRHFVANSPPVRMNESAKSFA